MRNLGGNFFAPQNINANINGIRAIVPKLGILITNIYTKFIENLPAVCTAIQNYILANFGVYTVHTFTYAGEKNQLITLETKKDIDVLADGFLFYFSIQCHKEIYSNALTAYLDNGRLAKILVQDIWVMSASIAENLTKFPTFDATVKYMDTGTLDSNATYLLSTRLPIQLLKYSIMAIPALHHPNPTIPEKAAFAIIGGAITYPIRTFTDSNSIPQNLNKEKVNNAFKIATNLYNDTVKAGAPDQSLNFANIMKSYKQGLLVASSKNDEFQKACKTLVDKIKNGALKNGFLEPDDATLNAISKLEEGLNQSTYPFESFIGGLNNLQIYFASSEFWSSTPLRLVLSGFNRVTEVEIRAHYHSAAILKFFTTANELELHPQLVSFKYAAATSVETSPQDACLNNSSDPFSEQCLVDEASHFITTSAYSTF